MKMQVDSSSIGLHNQTKTLPRYTVMTTLCILPPGWNLDMHAVEQDLGYSTFGLHMLQPKPEDWDVK